LSKLIPLEDEVKEIFEECVSNIRDQSLKTEYLRCTDEIVSDSAEYFTRMEQETVHEMMQKEAIQNVTKEQMINIYDRKLSKKGQPGRSYYDKILAIPQYGVCPYCGQRIVSTLDHFMAKSRYPSLVITPANLVPSCIDCNKLKLDKTFTTVEDIFINPYFNDLQEIPWLCGKINPQQDEFIVEFSVDRNVFENSILYRRYTTFFNMLELNKLYMAHSAQELGGLKKRLIKIYHKSGGKEKVIEYLNECIELEEYPLNHWKIVLYKTLLTDEWFLEEWLARQQII
jgi:5-methylcytosine-specific restriction endonuclease McrA